MDYKTSKYHSEYRLERSSVFSLPTNRYIYIYYSFAGSNRFTWKTSLKFASETRILRNNIFRNTITSRYSSDGKRTRIYAYVRTVQIGRNATGTVGRPRLPASEAAAAVVSVGKTPGGVDPAAAIWSPGEKPPATGKLAAGRRALHFPESATVCREGGMAEPFPRGLDFENYITYTNNIVVKNCRSLKKEKKGGKKHTREIRRERFKYSEHSRRSDASCYCVLL